MVLDDIFERFARAEPRHRHGPGRPGARPRPPGHRRPLRGDRRAAVHPHPAVLLGRGPDGHRRLPTIRPAINAAYQANAEALGVSLQAVYDKLDRIEPGVSAELVRHTARTLGAGHHGHGRRAAGLAAGLSRSRSSTATTWPGPSTGSRSCAPSGPGPCRARPWSCSTRRRCWSPTCSPARTATPRSGRCWIRSWRRSGPARSGSPTATSARPASSSGSPGGAASFVIRQHGATLHIEWIGRAAVLRADPRPGRSSSRRCGSATATAGRWWCGGSRWSWTSRPGTARPRSTS